MVDHRRKSVLEALDSGFGNHEQQGDPGQQLRKTRSSRMATEQHLLAALSHGPAEPLTAAQEETLRRAVAKVVEMGAQIGVTTDEMIQLLDSGLNVAELLEYLAARSGEIA
jgi:hypothetical protein